MQRKEDILIFGNGLGMALDHKMFSLEDAMKESWSRLNLDAQKIIQNSIGKCGETPIPCAEYDLLNVQRLCFYLQKENDTRHKSIQNYIAQVAKRFFDVNSNQISNEPIISSLHQYILENKGTHIATLNYDKLLYGALLSCGTFNGDNYGNKLLVDGFIKGKLDISFCKNNYVLHNGAGWFMHLHGTPLFQGTKGKCIKKNITEVENNNLKLDDASSSFSHHHLVLTAPKFKPDIIKQSEILKQYWFNLKDIICNSKKIYFIGYSGSDPHLNCFIRKYASLAKIYIIEWNFNNSLWYNKEIRKLFWQSKFENKNLYLKPMDNILKFKFCSN